MFMVRPFNKASSLRHGPARLTSSSRSSTKMLDCGAEILQIIAGFLKLIDALNFGKTCRKAHQSLQSAPIYAQNLINECWDPSNSYRYYGTDYDLNTRHPLFLKLAIPISLYRIIAASSLTPAGRWAEERQIILECSPVARQTEHLKSYLFGENGTRTAVKTKRLQLEDGIVSCLMSNMVASKKNKPSVSLLYNLLRTVYLKALELSAGMTFADVIRHFFEGERTIHAFYEDKALLFESLKQRLLPLLSVFPDIQIALSSNLTKTLRGVTKPLEKLTRIDRELRIKWLTELAIEFFPVTSLPTEAQKAATDNYLDRIAAFRDQPLLRSALQKSVTTESANRWLRAKFRDAWNAKKLADISFYLGTNDEEVNAAFPLKDRNRKKPAVVLAVERCDLELIHFFLERGADPNASVAGFKETTPLFTRIFRKKHSPDLVRRCLDVLLDAGTDLALHGRKALNEANLYGDHDLITYIHEKVAAVTTRVD
ncbi:hypothetical protein HDU97_006359 [Phlyctochytrium planicorne]|nr:hypothetical protein HDU97_006359 [Phlyctochytrium planicorne]